MSSKNEFIKINRRSFMKGTVLILIGVLISSCYFAAAGNIGNQNYPTSYIDGGPTGSYDYMVFTFENNTGTYYAAKDKFGKVVDSWTSTNANEIISTAWNLGDTYISSGNYVLNGAVNKTTHNYELTGSSTAVLTAIPDIGDNLINIVGVNGAILSNIHIDGNSANQHENHALDFGNSGVHLQNATSVTVKNLKITNTYAHGIITKWVNDCIFVDNTVNKAGKIDDGGVYSSEAGIVIFYQSYNNTVSRNHISNIHRGVYLSAYAIDNIISDNIILDANVGIHISSGGCRNNLISNNLIGGGSKVGINIQTPADVYPAGSYTTIIGNTIQVTQSGIAVANHSDTSIISNKVVSTSSLTVHSGSERINVYNNYFNATVWDNIVTNATNGHYANNRLYAPFSRTNFVEQTDAANNFITGNYFSMTPGGTTGKITLQANSNSTVTNNFNFVTETYGTATILSGDSTVWVAHKLRSTPTSVVVSGTHSEVNAVILTAKDSVNMQFSVSSPVSADRIIMWVAKYQIT